MKSRRAVSGVAAFGLVGVGAVGLSISGAAAPAQAFTGTCPTTVPAASLVADNVCEVRITTVGSSTFTPPSGITKLSAVLVAGGGGALISTGEHYAGSGGAVVYIDSVSTAGPVSISVGAGGAAGDGTGAVFVDSAPGGDTTLTAGATTTAAGGVDGENGSVPFCFGTTVVFRSGNGAQTNADSNCLAGVGYSLSQISGLDTTLFPAASLAPDVYGDGGTGVESGPVSPALGAGDGGSVNDTVAEPGADGVVILRFAPAAPAPPVTPPATAPALAATGTEVSWTVPAIAGGLVAVGAVLMSLRRRRQTAR